MAIQPFVVSCASCGKPFATIRHQAKYCGDACRQRASAARRRGGDVVQLPAKAEPPKKLTYAEQFVQAVRDKLEAADRLDEPISLLALSLAEDSVNTAHPPAARRSYTAEFRATYAEAMRGVRGAKTVIDELRDRRDALHAGSA